MAAAVNKPLRINFIGSGQVATHLSRALEAAGHRVLVVYSRQLAHATALAQKLSQAIPTDHLDFRDLPGADVYIISVADAAVEAIMKEVKFPLGSCVVHTAGSLPLTVLERDDLQLKAGVLYPIQTFSQEQRVNLAETPFALEAPDPGLAALLKVLAGSLSTNIVFIAGPERKQLHLAAVFACNFTNHLLGISHEILIKQNLPLTLLAPLIQTTVQKALKNNPYSVQTGPAVRGDENVMQEHIRLLTLEPVYAQIYRLLSESIVNKKQN